MGKAVWFGQQTSAFLRFGSQVLLALAVVCCGCKCFPKQQVLIKHLQARLGPPGRKRPPLVIWLRTATPSTYIGGQTVRRTMKRKSKCFCHHVPKCLPADSPYRPVDITIVQWKNVWKETRDGHNPEELPRSFQNTEYVEMRA